MENFEINRELLQLPKYALPYSMVVFGRPTQQQKDRIKPKRFELDDIVHTDIYHHKSLEETKNMLEKQSGKTGKEFEEYITAFAKKEILCRFQKGNEPFSKSDAKTVDRLE